MYDYKICMYLQFCSGADPDSFNPCEDKLYLEILLDEYRGDVCCDTIDCNGIELPLSLLHSSRKERKSFVKSIEDEIAENIAEMLVRNNISEYDFTGPINFDWLDIANAEGIKFDSPDLSKRLERLEW